MMKKFNVNIDKVRSQYLPNDFVRFHFNSSRKRMSTILEHIEKTEYNYDKRIHMKGASEYVLDSCSHYLNADGIKTELLDEMK